MTDFQHLPEEPGEDDVNLCGTPRAVCPYCRVKDEDSWEIFNSGCSDGDEQTVTCWNCEREYVVTLNIGISYSTRATRPRR